MPKPYKNAAFWGKKRKKDYQYKSKQVHINSHLTISVNLTDENMHFCQYFIFISIDQVALLAFDRNTQMLFKLYSLFRINGKL